MAGESQAVPSSAPDPTVLTTEQLLREITTLKDLFESEFLANRQLCDEKFRSVDRQLELVEKQRVEQKLDTQAAVQAALTAQKEAVREQTTAFALATDKSEAGTAKQLEQLGTTFKSEVSGVTRELSDLKDRVGKIENVKLGGQESKAALYAGLGVIVMLLLAGMTVIGFIAAGSP